MSNDSNDKIVKGLARKFSDLASELHAEHAPPPPSAPSPPPRKEYGYSGSSSSMFADDLPGAKAYRAPASSSGGVPIKRPISVGSYTVKTSRLEWQEVDSLGDKFKNKPNRKPQQVLQEGWDFMAAEPVTRSMTFDDWVRACCFEPFVKDFDPDYAAVARLYMEKKKGVHQGK